MFINIQLETEVVSISPFDDPALIVIGWQENIVLVSCVKLLPAIDCRSYLEFSLSFLW